MTARAKVMDLMKMIPDSEMPTDIDDIATPEDTAAHLQAMKEYETGETIAFEDINWD